MPTLGVRTVSTASVVVATAFVRLRRGVRDVDRVDRAAVEVDTIDEGSTELF